jgi:DNA-binding response OmpR family regulator
MGMPKEKSEQYNILIIDDDSFLLDMYALKFSQRNFNVTSTSGTLLALEKLRAGYVPEIILVDLVMPAMDGFEFLEKIRSEGLASQAMIIILSNLGQQEDIDRGLLLGASGYIIKASATPSEVVEKVLETMEKNHHKK